jgi:hypothetical protein
MGATILFRVAFVGLVACTSSGAGDDAGVDGGTNTLKCGTGGITGMVRLVDATTLGPIAGATVTGLGCGATTTDDTGSIQADLQQGLLVKVELSATGYISAHSEATPQASGFLRTVFMEPVAAKTSLFTGWTSGSGYAIALISPDGTDAGACHTSDLLVASINGHPEIPVGYLADQLTRDSSATSTSNFGIAVFGPMPPGTYEFDAVKAGCAAGPDHGVYFLWPQTMDVEADTLSMVQLKLQ